MGSNKVDSPSCTADVGSHTEVSRARVETKACPGPLHSP